MGWQPIERGKPEVLGIHPQYSGLLRVEIPLVGDVDGYWTACFKNPTGLGISLSMHPPKIYGNTVEITPGDGDLESYLEHIDDRIDAANKYYRSHLLPEIEAEAGREDAERKRAEERLNAARQAAEGL